MRWELFAVLVTFSGSALAQSAGSVAETLFREGRALQKAGKISEACPKYAASYKLEPKAGALINLAACHEEEGKLATAWAEFGEAAALSQRAGQADRATVAKDRRKALEPKLSRVILLAEGGTSVRLDGVVMPSEIFMTPFPLDPGEHRIEATQTGMKPWSSTFSVAAGSTEVPKIPIGPFEAEKAAEPAPPPAPSPALTAAPDASKSPQPPWLGWGLVGLGAAGIGVGGYFGLTTLSLKKDVDNLCTPQGCSPEAFAKNDDAHTNATVATVAMAAGAVALAAGVYCVVTPSSAPPCTTVGRMYTGVGSFGVDF